MNGRCEVFLLFYLFTGAIRSFFSQDVRAEKIISALSSTLDSFLDEPAGLNLDVILGLFVARGNLAVIDDEAVSEIQRKCEFLLEEFLKNGVGDHETSSEFVPYFQNVSLWTNLVRPLKKLESLQYGRKAPQFLPRRRDYAENFSDRCLLSLLEERCDAPAFCWVAGDDFGPYGQLHFLLFLQIAEAIHCRQGPLDFIYSKKLRHDICSDHLLRILREQPMNLKELDVQLEAIALCGGVEGIIDFARSPVQLKFLHFWKDGCFGEEFERRTYVIMSMETTGPDGKNIQHNIKEGQAEILVQPGSHVFYNPVQEFNRDLSISVLTLFAEKYHGKSGKTHKSQKIDNSEEPPKPLRILEALSATGLRSIRYAKEIPGLGEVVANDISAAAIENIEKNVVHNGVQDLVKTSHNDAIEVMFNSRHPPKRFDAIDLDPYGCPSQFLDSAVQAVADGGLLLVTCTDMAVLCGNTPETCYTKYGAVCLRNKACHEMALRIVLQHIESHANRYKRYIVPLLSVSVDFYVRVFVRVFTSSVECKNTTSKLSMVYQCTGCETMTFQSLGATKQRTKPDGKPMPPKYILPAAPAVGSECIHCKSTKHHMGGPIWTAPIHDVTFISELADVIASKDLGTKNRLTGIVNVIREELHDVPLYYSHDRLCSVVHVTSMPMMPFRSALLNAGYKVSYSHASKTSIKTSAPMSVLWDVIRAWAAEHPVSEKKLSADRVARALLGQPNQEIDFSLRKDANPLSREMKLVRYQENPTPFWGPGTRASVNVQQGEQMDKKKKNQNKKRKREIEMEGDDESFDAKQIAPDDIK